MEKGLQERTVLEYLIRLGAVLGPLAGVPQAIEVWSSSGTGVSAASWVFFLATSCLWLAHAVRRNDRVLALSNVMWVVVEVVIILGLVKGGR